jgi:antitoxin (DNA-binding transcriptional repressor) of toxin-antitoxin stability system
MALSRREIAKDAVQQGVEAAITTSGRISAILFDTARRITTEVGAFGTELFEITEASRRAGEDPEDAEPTARTHPRDL